MQKISGPDARSMIVPRFLCGSATSSCCTGKPNAEPSNWTNCENKVQHSSNQKSVNQEIIPITHSLTHTLKDAHIHPKCFTSYIIKTRTSKLKSGFVGSHVLWRYSLSKNTVSLSLYRTDLYCSRGPGFTLDLTQLTWPTPLLFSCQST